MSPHWNFDPAGAAALEPAGHKPTPRRLRTLLRREQETLISNGFVTRSCRNTESPERSAFTLRALPRTLRVAKQLSAGAVTAA